jgi:hypothetical protein
MTSSVGGGAARTARISVIACRVPRSVPVTFDRPARGR